MKVVTAAQMQAIDRRAIEECGVPGETLMENAGRAVFAALRDALGGVAGRSVAVVCGRGNNGGDGMVVARLARESGAQVHVLLAGRQQEMRGDAALNLRRARLCGIPIAEVTQDFSEDTPPPHVRRAMERADSIVDALLGTGAKGAAEGVTASLIGCINRARTARGIPVVSIDVPSGIDADTGAVPGPAVQADCTVTMGLPKVGLVTFPAAGHVGRLRVADIGIPAHAIEQAECSAEWVDEGQVAALFKARRPDAHKGDFGRVFIVAGSVGMTGAAALCAEAALRSGAGLVTLGVPASLNDILEVKLTEVITLPLPETAARTLAEAALEPIMERLRASDAFAVGPGLSQHPETAALVARLVQSVQIPTVIDADGLNNLAKAPDVLKSPWPKVITPHPGEMARLVGVSTAEVQGDRLGAAVRAAERFGCVVVLKGAKTVVAAPGQVPLINSTGNPGMASGGTGDVLTGMIAGLLGQGMGPLEAATAAVYLHGLCGDLAAERQTQTALVAGDLLRFLPAALRRVKAP